MLDPEKSLYHRLGGYDAIAAFADDLLSRLTADPQLAVYWKGKCKDSMSKDRQLLIDFLCDAAGGPVRYVGRDMKKSHEGLGITESEWNVFAQHAVASLDDLGVAEREKNELLTMAASYQADIVEVPQASASRA
ncbi:MAG TPA: group 1 truncated hemoglobin [Bryobacteraceae bacterium]|nr:group 1 truncated hemoglobin [Bryobacteraceae bacterium]